jgi:hypothetical protein
LRAVPDHGAMVTGNAIKHGSDMPWIFHGYVMDISWIFHVNGHLISTKIRFHGHCKSPLDIHLNPLNIHSVHWI